MIFQPYYYPETGCAAYVIGCGGLGKCAIVDPHAADVDRYVAFAGSKGMPTTFRAARPWPSEPEHATAFIHLPT